MKLTLLIESEEHDDLELPLSLASAETSPHGNKKLYYELDDRPEFHATVEIKDPDAELPGNTISINTKWKKYLEEGYNDLKKIIMEKNNHD